MSLAFRTWWQRIHNAFLAWWHLLLAVVSVECSVVYLLSFTFRLYKSPEASIWILSHCFRDFFGHSLLWKGLSADSPGTIVFQFWATEMLKHGQKSQMKIHFLSIRCQVVFSMKEFRYSLTTYHGSRNCLRQPEVTRAKASNSMATRVRNGRATPHESYFEERAGIASLPVLTETTSLLKLYWLGS